MVLAALRQRDVLAMLPTGGGKSICFQVPALLAKGTTVVISPLISLMQDQVAALRRRDLPAAYLSSTQSPAIQRRVWDSVHEGRIKLLYVAPERMKQLVERRDRLPIPLFAVDEAHCISEWGHDFRPHYRALGQHRQALGMPPTVAVTATATPATQDDIVRILRLKRPVSVVGSYDRPNLEFAVERFVTERDRLVRTVGLLRTSASSGIVYVPTRNRTDAVAGALRYRGFAAAPYHAGLPPSARRALLARFLDGRIRVMVATNAFGMGIDKPDVRHVIHLGIPMRPEAYYQEAGRAGRDGLPSWCHLLWTKPDLAMMMGMARLDERPRDRQAKRLRQIRRDAVATMRRYVATRRCRRRILLGYFGEVLGSCAGCDRCDQSMRRSWRKS